jgi:N-methylhydantoinase B/oxoprolinase/acetone carboxylase alpha subunit
VAALRKLERTIAKRLKQAVATASSGSVAAQAMVGALTAQITSIEAQIDHISSLDAMRQQKHAVPASQGASRSVHSQLLKQAQKSKQAEQNRELTTADADGNNSASQKLKPFRFDFTGTIVDDTA